ncbi:metal dependent phosphohydrolase [Thermotomaculum hydrothermale]|uniref:Metal dependent phosphohydrolase n=1 Tax=Thermotomaculum hydrothermale TaxID=981385 RepID=A0A7R6PQF0_9BACT|nr:HD domain-containing phosphohydrolase [Thermotomaculum hydrothermale]BBB32456.1 metal dependent phosphohydrolase [Thermotomaculum hydrothermale]
MKFNEEKFDRFLKLEFFKKIFLTYSIKKVLLVIAIILAVIPLIISDFILIKIAEKNLLLNQRQTHTTISWLIANQTEKFLKIMESKVESVKTTILFNSIDSSLPDIISLLDERKTLVDFLENTPEIDYILIKDTQGHQAFALNTSFDTKNALDEKLDLYIINCLHENREIKSPPIFLNQYFKYYIFFVYPVNVGNNRGVIAIAVNMDNVFANLKVKLPTGYNFLIVDKEGSIIGAKNTTLVGDKIDITVFNKEQNNLIFDEFQGQKIIASSSFVPGFDMSVITYIPRETAYKYVKKMKTQTITFGILAVLFASILSIFLSNAFHEPINDLINVTEKISKRNFSVRANIVGSNEITVLAKRINFTVEEIEKYIKRLESLIRYNKRLFISTITALAAAIDAKDEYTRGHSERVTKISVIIGKYLGLNAIELERIKVAGLLHDIGKIGIDDKILRKPGILTAEEFEEMKKHPVIGYNILAPIKELKEINKGVKYHHEKWDGSGYPEGLKGEQIPLIARIIAVADTFDAMTSRRPYQDPMDPEFVRDKIMDFAGIRYDRRVVAAFVKAFNSGEFNELLNVDKDDNNESEIKDNNKGDKE